MLLMQMTKLHNEDRIVCSTNSVEKTVCTHAKKYELGLLSYTEHKANSK